MIINFLLLALECRHTLLLKLNATNTAPPQVASKLHPALGQRYTTSTSTVPTHNATTTQSKHNKHNTTTTHVFSSSTHIIQHLDIGTQHQPQQCPLTRLLRHNPNTTKTTSPQHTSSGTRTEVYNTNLNNAHSQSSNNTTPTQQTQHHHNSHHPATRTEVHNTNLNITHSQSSKQHDPNTTNTTPPQLTSSSTRTEVHNTDPDNTHTQSSNNATPTHQTRHHHHSHHPAPGQT